jgi:outer membrane protein assembly factor BamA
MGHSRSKIPFRPARTLEWIKNNFPLLFADVGLFCYRLKSAICEDPMHQSISGIFIFLFAFSPIVFGQSTRPPNKIAAVHCKGLQHFTETQFLAAINIHIGETFDKQQINAGVQKLAQSGAFQEISYSYQPTGGVVTLEFVVKEATKFHHCVFDNFVWMPESELQAMLREKVPLYDGSAPENGGVLDEISAALENAASRQHLSGTVGHIQLGVLGGRDWEHVFSITGPAIKISNVHFTGTQKIEEIALVREGKSLIDRQYSLVECRQYGSLTFPEYYRERGFLRVKVGEPSAQISKHDEGNTTFEVQVSYPVTEGLQYQFDGVQWQSNVVLTEQKLDRFLGLKPGEIANSKKLEAGWAAIEKEYGTQGYIDANFEPNPIFDDTTQKVRFQVPVQEGQQYRMGTFNVTGLPPELVAKLQSKWRLKSGQVYDASYMLEFYKKELPSVLGQYGNNSIKVVPKETKNSAQQTVDMDLHFQ